MMPSTFIASCLLLFILPAALFATPASSSTPASSTQGDLEAINGTTNYRLYGKKGKDDKPWLIDLDSRHIHCVRRSRCLEVNATHNTCLGSKLPYGFTSLGLTDYRQEKELDEALSGYYALRHVPKCWAVIQPFLCAVFKPKCEVINGQDMVYLPSYEMCKITLEPCRMLYNTTFFPKFLRCNETLFPMKCSNDAREMKFNVTGKCLAPLVPADNAASYYPGIEGCGVQCKDPLYTDDEHRQIHKLIGYGGTLCLLSNLFVVATFLIDWQNANKYPAVIVFYINLCFLISCFGWLVQFTSGSREDIVCRKDGTLRHSEPTAGENLSCIVIFVLVYYFLTAGMVWFVFLTYAWHWRAMGHVQDRIDKKGSYFHLVAWSLPLVLTITTMALSEVDGSGIVGICFVGYTNHSMRAGLLLGPLCGVILIGGYFITRGMIMLFGLKHFANDIKSTSASNKIHLIIMRMGVCALLTLIFILVAIACHVTEFRHSTEWAESLRQYIICRITSVFDENSVCKIENRPSVGVLQLHLLCLFSSGILMSTWCWTPSSIETWKRYIKKKCGKEVVEEVKMPKHKVIAQTWAKRKDFEDKGRLSITLYNTHTDPVGLNFDVNDLNSSETNEISSTWVHYLPQCVKRRMALTGVTTGNTNSSSQGQAGRKNSLDSEISVSVRHVSVESRRNSVDSQVSVKIAEMKTKVASRSRQHGKHGGYASSSNKRTQRRRDFIAASSGRTKYSSAGGRGRRESSTSVESQVIALKKTTYPNASHKVGMFAQSTKKQHNSSRRRNGGLDPTIINEFIQKNGQFILPFLQNQGMTTSSDEEENSRASFKIQDLNVVVKQELSDDDDDDDDVDAGPKIQELPNNGNKAAALEHFLKHMQKSGESNRHSRNSQRSRKSRNKESTNKSHKHGGLELDLDLDMDSNSDFKHKYARQLAAAIDVNGDSLSCSSAELDIPLDIMLHSSYSGLSTGKPNSRNSKTSCDVGIQANPFDIATHTLPSYGNDELQQAMRLLNAASRQRNELLSEEATEMQSLLGPRHQKEPTIMSESDKLKMLLLPSK
ncbi:protein smoothened isoform X1 [Drosophila nasuta]|uniref:protein smoothened isoform X1 n=1 Tax=Drosophila nasuta TaxID=42062 RepID=UPI00295E7493|nr:protein smoothened isoform X1 [Drosophila nasuta]XP_060666476.1 protein smoothened isoform X1 [Drosophila nasuta]